MKCNCNDKECDCKDEECNCKKKHINTTSDFNYNWPVKQLDTENWEMVSIPTEYGFYKQLLILLLSNFLRDLKNEKIIEYNDAPTAEWLAEMFLNDKLTYIPVIDSKRCYIKNIINSKEIIIYNYSDLSDLTVEDCLIKMLNDLKDLYNF